MIQFIMIVGMVTGFLFVLFLGMAVSGSIVGTIIGTPFMFITAAMFLKLVQMYFRELSEIK